MAENILFTPPPPPIAAASATSPVAASTPASIPPPQVNRPGAKSWLPTQPSGTPPPPPHGSSLGILFRIGIVLLVILLLVGVGAYYFFHSSQGSGNTKVTLVYWGIWESKQTMQPILDAFHKQYPNITIDYQQQDIKQLAKDNQNYPKRLMARISTGNGPDIFRFHNSWYPMIASVLAPLTSDVVSPQEFSATYFPVVSHDLVHNGAIYGIPIGFDDLAMFVNPQIFSGSKVPADWNDFEKAATSLTAKGNDGTITTAGAALGTLKNITHGADIMGLLFADSDVDPANMNASSDKAGTAMQYFTKFTASTNATWNESLPPSVEVFAQGNLAIYLGYSWDIFTIKSLNPALQFTIYPVPNLFQLKRTLASYWVEGVSLHSSHQKEAMLFMKFLNQKETQQQFYASAAKLRGFGEPYARTDLASTLKDNPQLMPFEQQGPDAVSSLFVQDTYDGGINDLSDQYLGKAIAQASQGSASTAVSTLANGIKQVLATYGH